MTKEIKETIEGLKEKQQLCIAMGCPQGQFLSTAIGWGEELVDIKETYKNIIDEKCAGDEKHCTCVPALRKKIEELKKKVMASKCIAEGIATVSLEYFDKLQSLKKKLTVENLEKIIHKSDLCKAANKGADWVTRRIRKRDLVKAIRELGEK